jgi:hypothetical protein
MWLGASVSCTLLLCSCVPRHRCAEALREAKRSESEAREAAAAQRRAQFEAQQKAERDAAQRRALQKMEAIARAKENADALVQTKIQATLERYLSPFLTCTLLRVLIDWMCVAERRRRAFGWPQKRSTFASSDMRNSASLLPYQCCFAHTRRVVCGMEWSSVCRRAEAERAKQRAAVLSQYQAQEQERLAALSERQSEAAQRTAAAEQQRLQRWAEKAQAEKLANEDKARAVARQRRVREYEQHKLKAKIEADERRVSEMKAQYEGLMSQVCVCVLLWDAAGSLSRTQQTHESRH